MGCGQSALPAAVDAAPSKAGMEKPVNLSPAKVATPETSPRKAEEPAAAPAKAAEPEAASPAAAEETAPASPAPVAPASPAPAAPASPAEEAPASPAPVAPASPGPVAPASPAPAAPSDPEAAPQEALVVPAVPGDIPADATIIFVLGGPGSGKGTQCDKIKERYAGVVHLSAGDLLRAEVKSGSDVGTKCNVLMTEGKLVPLEVTIVLLKNAMITSGGNLFLVDGFPRAQDQADAFEKTIMPAKAVLFFDCTDEEMEKRLMKRGETSGRADDNAETIRKRFHTFVKESLPVKHFYVEKGKASAIDSCRSPDEVFEDVKAALDKLGLAQK